MNYLIGEVYMNKVFLFTGKLYIDKGGGTNRVILNRSKSLIRQGYDVSILTISDFNTKNVETKLKKVGRLDDKVKHLNIYEYYKKINTINGKSKMQIRYFNQGATLEDENYHIEIDKPNFSAKYFKSGVYVKNKQWSKNGTLKYIDYYNNSNHTKIREKYHNTGYIQKIEYWNKDFKSQIQYFTIDGYCFLDVFFEEKNKKRKYHLYNRESLSVKRFNNSEEFYTYWLNHMCSAQDSKPFLICDKITYAPSVINMEKNIAYRICSLHSNHLKSPYKVGSPKNPPHKIVLDNMDKLDSVVILTNNQKEDIIQEFGDYDNISVIPHSVPNIPIIKAKKKKSTVSLVARLAPVKRIQHSIIAFQQVVKQFPDARLEIFGSGKLKSELKSKIKELHLENNVFLKGYSQDTDLIYQSSLVTLLTSKSEAFALVILESMINGTPVISYDINYGPNDIITNKKDGYLIEENIDVLANKIIKLLKKPRKAHKMGKRARKNALHKFDEKLITSKWIELFNYLNNKS